MKHLYLLRIYTAALSVIAIMVLSLGTANAAGGDFVWAKAMGGTSDEYGQSVTVDTVGNVYTTGQFSGTADFDPGAATFNLTSVGGSDIFVSKLDLNGDFLWAKSIGAAIESNGNSSQDYGLSIAVDTLGNVYTTGRFDGTADFDPGVGTFNLMSAGGGDIFVVKMDSNGNYVWAKGIGGSSFDVSESISLDAFSNVYTTGSFSGTVDFDPGAGTFNLSSAGFQDIFVSKLDANGNFVWAKSMAGLGGDYGLSIVLDVTGNIYTTGYFSGTVDFNPGAGTYNLTSAGENDVFVSKLDANGNFMWAKGMGGTSQSYGRSVAVDTMGNVYTTGDFYNTADFDPGLGSFNLTSEGSKAAFVSKLDTNGNFVWAKAMMGEASDVNGYSIAVDASGNVYTTGYFEGTVDFDPGVCNYRLSTVGGSDIYLTKLDTSGNFLWAGSIGSIKFDQGYSLTIDASGNLYATGSFTNTADFDPDQSTDFRLTAAGEYDSDLFVMKLKVNSLADSDCSGEGEGEGEGESEGQPAITVNPNTDVVFGDLSTGDAVEQTVVISNSGGGALSGALTITGEGFSIVENPNFSLNADTNITYTILFSTIQKGPASGVLAISSNGGATITLNFSANVTANSPFACGLSSGNDGSNTGDLLVVLLCILIIVFYRVFCDPPIRKTHELNYHYLTSAKIKKSLGKVKGN